MMISETLTYADLYEKLATVEGYLGRHLVIEW